MSPDQRIVDALDAHETAEGDPVTIVPVSATELDEAERAGEVNGTMVVPPPPKRVRKAGSARSKARQRGMAEIAPIAERQPVGGDPEPTAPLDQPPSGSEPTVNTTVDNADASIDAVRSDEDGSSVGATLEALVASGDAPALVDPESRSVPSTEPDSPVPDSPVPDELVPTELVTFLEPETEAVPVTTPTRPLEVVRQPAPVISSKRSVNVTRRRGRPRVRRVRRVLRSIDTWTVFKISVPFYLALYVICLTAGVLLWRLASITHVIDNVENFLENYGWETFKFRGGEIYHSAWIIGLFLVVAGVGINVTAATLYNLIADLLGGIRVTVLEEEVRLVPRERVVIDDLDEPSPLDPDLKPPAPAVELNEDLTSEIVSLNRTAS